MKSIDFVDAVRNAVSLGGDADTLACITGAIAEAYYDGVPDSIQNEMFQRVDDPMKKIIKESSGNFVINY